MGQLNALRVFREAFSPDGNLIAAAGEDRTLRLWDPTTGKQIGQPLTGHGIYTSEVTFSPDGNMLASADGDMLRLWDPAKRKLIGQPLTSVGPVTTVAFSPDGTRLASASETTVRLWDVWQTTTACDLSRPFVTKDQVAERPPAPWTESRCNLR